MQQRCDPKNGLKGYALGGKDMTEEAIVRGLNWLKNVQILTAVGKTRQSDKGEKYGGYEQHRDAMTSMALLAYLDIVNYRILQNSAKR